MNPSVTMDSRGTAQHAHQPPGTDRLSIVVLVMHGQLLVALQTKILHVQMDFIVHLKVVVISLR
jgi:hypothetical protein